MTSFITSFLNYIMAKAFIPKEGQIDYTHIRVAPVVNSVVVKDGKILLVKRNEELRFYPGLWNGISGFLDDNKSVTDKIYEELEEELGITRKKVQSVETGDILVQIDQNLNKEWHIHPVKVLLRDTHTIALNREATEYRFVPPEEVAAYNIVPGFIDVVRVFYKDI